MLISLDLPPQLHEAIVISAKEQGMSVNEYLLEVIHAKVNEPTDRLLFDMDVMKERLKGFESREEALKNGTPIPKGLDRDGLLAWLANERAKRQELA